MYFVLALLMAGMALVLWRMLPAPSPASVSGGYFALLRSVLQLLLSERTLRVRGVFALLIFAAFSVLWTSMVLPLRIPKSAYLALPA